MVKKNIYPTAGVQASIGNEQENEHELDGISLLSTNIIPFQERMMFVILECEAICNRKTTVLYK